MNSYKLIFNETHKEFESKEALQQFLQGFEETKLVEATETDLPRLSLSPSEVWKNRDRYQLIETLGEGGMGVVQRVRDAVLTREVALKSIKLKTTASRLSLKEKVLQWRLKTEASITAILEHPHIVPLYDLDQRDSGEVYFTMRKVEGKTLKDLLIASRNKEQTPSQEAPEDFLAIFLKVCDAIAYAHSKGVIHRDLKPENIMVGAFGEVYVMDWGIAKKLKSLGSASPSTLKGLSLEPLEEMEEDLEKANAFLHTEEEEQPEELSPENASSPFATIGGLGTMGYMPPEQRSNASQVSFQADIYALGKILRQCFTTLSPVEEFRLVLKKYEGQTEIPQSTSQRPSKRFQRQKDRNPEELIDEQIPMEIRSIILKATEEAPEERYSTVQALMEDVQRYQKNLKILVKEYGLWESFTKWLQRNRQRVYSFSAILLLCLIFGSYLLWNHYEIKRQKREEEQIRQQAEQAKLEENFRQARKHAVDTENVALKETEIGLKIGYSLQAFNHLNRALSLKQGEPETETLKWNIGKAIIQQCYETQDYQLASYVSRELQGLQVREEGERNALLEEVEAEKTKLLKQHLVCFEYWEKRFLQGEGSLGEREDALFELSQMKEKELLERMLSLVKESTSYFIDKHPSDSKKEFWYKLVVSSLGRSENPKGIPTLLESLKKFDMQLSLDSAEGQISDAFQDYAVELMNALANLNAKEAAILVQKVQTKFESGSTFSDKISIASRKLAPALIQYYNQNFEKHPEKAMLYFIRGNAKQDQHDYSGAIEDFSKALETNPHFAEAYINRGVLLTQEKIDFKRAIEDFSEALRLNPYLIFAYTNRGNARKESGDLQGAIEDYSTSIRLHPENADAYSNRGNAKSDLGDFQGALEDYTSAIQKKKNYFEAYKNRAVVQLKMKNYSESIQDCNEAIRIFPQDFYAYCTRGNAKKAQKDFQGALQDYTSSLEINPHYVKAFLARGNLRSDLKNYNEAIADYSEIIRLDPTSSTGYSSRGEVKRLSGDIQGALTDLNKALEVDPQNVMAYINRGTLKNNDLNDMKGALEDIQKAISLSPKENPLLYYNQGAIFSKLDRKAEALKSFEKAIELQPEFAEVFTERGTIYASQGKRKEAIEDFSSTIRLNPTYFPAYFNRALLKHGMKDIKGAILDLEAVVQIHPRLLQGHLFLGSMKAEQGDLQGAIEAFNKGIQFHPQSFQLYGARGEIFGKLKEVEKAIPDLEKGIELAKNSKHPEAQNSKKTLEKFLSGLKKQSQK
jgi:tetratricopeptide (TPR) repeat protein/tRNA A-37 threonylcarbamoyl transferase component Bud32